MTFEVRKCHKTMGTHAFSHNIGNGSKGLRHNVHYALGTLKVTQEKKKKKTPFGHLLK